MGIALLPWQPAMSRTSRCVAVSLCKSQALGHLVFRLGVVRDKSTRSNVTARKLHLFDCHQICPKEALLELCSWGLDRKLVGAQQAARLPPVRVGLFSACPPCVVYNRYNTVVGCMPRLFGLSVFFLVRQLQLGSWTIPTKNK